MLSKRIQYIIKQVDYCDIVNDVGCDHGYVGMELLRLNKANKVVFSDVSQPSLSKSQKLFNKSNIDGSRAEFVCADGIVCQSDIAIIAGMGGLEIINILQNAQRAPTKLILQPMRNIVELRRYLIGKYHIEIDITVFDSKFYSVIVAKIGQDDLDELQLEYGKTNIEQMPDDFVAQMEFLTQKYRTLYDRTGKIVYINKLKQIEQIKKQVRDNNEQDI